MSEIINTVSLNVAAHRNVFSKLQPINSQHNLLFSQHETPKIILHENGQVIDPAIDHSSFILAKFKLHILNAIYVKTGHRNL